MASAASGQVADKSDRPNVLFIAVDDLRPELGCYGVDEIVSPTIDALAERGVTFARAYCQQAVCNPSRVSLLTGLRPDSAKVWDLVTEFRDTVPDAVTLPQHFKQHGYYTVGMGKIFHNPFPDPPSWSIPKQPEPEGHRLYSAGVVQKLQQARAEALRTGMSEQQIGRRIRGPATDCEDVPDNERYDGALCDLALKHLRLADAQGKPFFLAVGFILPHLPWTPPKRYWDLYDPSEISLAKNGFLPKGMPPVAFGDRAKGGMYELTDCMDFKGAPSPFDGSLTEDQQRRLKHGYYASVSFVDAQVGRLLGELDRLDLTDNTIVVLWGDHGWKLGEHNGWCKQTNYEVDTRSPLLIAAPGAESKGKRCDALVEFVDIYPTLCELAGLPVPTTLEGVSLAPLLDDATGSVKTAALSQFPRRHDGVQYMGYAMRTDRHRYVEWLRLDTTELAAVELYDEQADPHENVNIAENPGQEDLRRRLHAQLWTNFTRPEPGMQLRPRKPKISDVSKRPEVHFENHRGEPVSVYWIPERGPPRQVGFIARGERQTQRTTVGHRFLLIGAITKSRFEFTAQKDGQTFVLDPKDGQEVPGNESGGSRNRVEVAEQSQDFKVTAPPPELYVDPFYKKYTSVRGYPIVASNNVNNYALKEAAHLIGMMTANRPDVLQMMIASGSRMCILSHNEYTTDLPEFAHFKPKDYWDARARGTGGSLNDPLCTCGEENLLGYPGDPYATENILIHEFAHNIHLRGLVHLDPTFDERLKKAYRAAMEKGLWKGKYAAVNHHEYFAEGVQSWFDNNRQPDHDHNHVDTRQELIAYDPGLADICREVFGDTQLKYTKPATRLHGHLAGYKPDDAPTFTWPERLKKAQQKIHEQVQQRIRKAAARGPSDSTDNGDADSPVTPSNTKAGRERPNIVFIFTDDQRFDAIGAVDPAVKTPNLDRLAAQGTRYANAFVTLSICSPSRAAVMTGQYGSVNGVTTLGRRVAAASPLLPKLLRDAGYRTGMYGKWHLGNQPAEIGFDESNYFHSNGTFYGRKANVDGETVTVPGYIDEAVADWSVAFIKRAHAERRPFFLWHCTQVPHMDHTFDWPARQPYLDMYDVDKMPLPPTWQDDLAGKPPYLKTARSRTRALEYGYDDPAEIRRHIQRYRAATTQMDATLGRVIDTVDQLGLSDNTWFIFMGDNGWQIGDHGFTSKVLAYEESIRVPMIVAGPGTAAGVDERLALNMDLPATILDIAGINIPATMHGRSLLTPSSDWRDAFVYEAPTPVLGTHPVMAVRDARWKLIRTYDPKAPQRVAFTELYDLQNDPHEVHNLADEPENADRVACMARRIAQHDRTIRRPRTAARLPTAH